MWGFHVRGSENKSRSRRFAAWPVRMGLAAAVVFGAGSGAWAVLTDLALVGTLHRPQAVHADQDTLLALVQSGRPEQAFEEAFELGRKLFETEFNALDGVGANVGKGQRFTQVPRADLRGPGEWANHVPARRSGPSTITCGGCHLRESLAGSGPASANVHSDPLHSADLGKMIQRNPPHLFGLGAMQRLAEDMTGTLHAIRAQAKQSACQSGSNTQPLVASGVSFGTITARRTRTSPCTVAFDTSGVEGVDGDLVVKPFQWKGSVAFVRDFVRSSAHNDLGMQAVELTGDGVDGDGDGVANELSVGDQTALAVYLAAQPRPVTKLELDALGLLEPSLTPGEITTIQNGRAVFGQIGCAVCHTRTIVTAPPGFSEPSQSPGYRDTLFPAGQDPVDHGVDPAWPVTFDLTADQPDNHVDVGGGQILNLGAFERAATGGAIVELYGDLKRHDLGPGLAEAIDDAGTGASVFLTENLWGVGSTAPYLHDGRATTLTEAILEHGGEAAASRAAFEALSPARQAEVIAFLDNLVLFKLEAR